MCIRDRCYPRLTYVSCGYSIYSTLYILYMQFQTKLLFNYFSCVSLLVGNLVYIRHLRISSLLFLLIIFCAHLVQLPSQPKNTQYVQLNWIRQDYNSTHGGLLNNTDHRNLQQSLSIMRSSRFYLSEHDLSLIHI